MRHLTLILCGALFFAGCARADERGPAPTVLPDPVASLDIANSDDGSYPGGSTPVEGTWYIEKSAVKLKLKSEPLVIGWLEFGPEIREKGATILVLARGPGGGRLKSRIGAGLYGKNGFQIRLDQGKGVVELVRRGIVLESVPHPTDPEKLYELELNVVEDQEKWVISGRVWEYETERPEDPLFSHHAYADQLLFPLAGRPVIVATPFSGEPVQYASARAYLGDPFEPVSEEEASDEEE